MNRIFYAMLLLVIFAPLARGQNIEAFGGYSYNRIDNSGGLRDHLDANGFEGAATFYFRGNLGATGDVSGHYRSADISGTLCPPGMLCAQVINNYHINHQLYNFLGGLQYKSRNGSRVQPFAHALFGVAHTRAVVHNLGPAGNPPRDLGSFVISRNDFAMGLGGGVDVKATNRFDLRLIQVDYNPVFYDERNYITHFGGVITNGARSDNVRLSVGVVFK